ncbi:MAG: hypothetical protein A3J48_04040 [Candidatus Doudnabacteria bacterium RIFCSPHIGHO2_02_FULL_46_11]|uniref:AI-2E family transporter n=1 Tax=Candidatus Doudnabacteria bacterium RIFCSPHIGHO2_02_FULL_46_11 TaxID=1817832 RepID=A0A1F5P849_9BACT|nr:MAG: hypothetical protein A3J48_04040 [Candidatus Doudnabacteria bacterium RIFCSPHIGHO2_02_FULL_46_11]
MNALNDTFRSAVFIVGLVIISIIFLSIVGGLLVPIFYGLVFAIILSPFYRRLLEKLRNKKSPAALIVIFLAVLILVCLFYVFGSLLFKDSLLLIDNIAAKVDQVSPKTENIGASIKEILPSIISERIAEINLRDQIVGYAQGIAGGFVNFIQSLAGNLVKMIALALITFYSTFYFLKNGREWLSRAVKLAPLPEGDGWLLSSRFIVMVRTSLKMIFVMGAIQGVLGGLIFWILGITAPFFWGLIFALASLIPGLGHQIVWVPTAIILLILGSPVKAVILVLYGLFILGLSDDLLRPYLIGRSVAIHPFVILIATVGGIATLGFKGLIIGPVVASLLMAMLALYEKRYST